LTIKLPNIHSISGYVIRVIVPSGVKTFTKMLSLRKDTEQALGAKFNPMRFHDFILSQGILTPALTREAVMSEFLPAEKMR